MNFLGRFSAPIYAMFRIVVGFLFMAHGLQKVFGVLGGKIATSGLPLIAGYIELLGGLCVMIGLFTTVAAFICSGTMAAAYFIAHAKQGWFPIENRGELAALYAFTFLYIAAHGSGIWSVDALIFRRDTTPAAAR